MSSAWPLQGKTILVTGAARRIGRSIALRLASEGARVLIHYATSEDEARATAQECSARSGVESHCYRAELTRVDEIERMFASIAEREGRLDALINNAARFTRFDPLDVTEADWDSIHDVNLKATFFCAQHAARLMLKGEGEGRIVNIASMGAFLAWAEHAHYCASKAGVVALTRALAKAWAPRISVNAVAPGVIPFDEIDEPRIQSMARATPVGRVGTGDEIADAVHFFLTTSNFVTGQTLQVDGGLGLR